MDPAVSFRDDRWVPLLVDAALPAGSLRGVDQPRLAVDGDFVLRPWGSADVGVVRAAFGCPEIQRWHVRRMDCDAEALGWIEGWAAKWDAETDASWAVADPLGCVVGQVGLRGVSLFESFAELSYWVLPDARGAGVAGRAVLTMSEWVFEALRLNRLFLKHSTRNVASCRVARKAGFEAEGTLRQSMLHADGWHDAHVHGRLRTGLIVQ